MKCLLNTGVGRTLFPVSIAAILFAACSPAAYKVNPPPVAIPEGTPSTTWRDELDETVVEENPEIVTEIPESQKDGYMRIVGDLRWDQLTSMKEWMNRFPECLSDQGVSWNNELYKTSSLTNSFPKPQRTPRYESEDRKCKNFSPASIPINIQQVSFSDNSGTDSGTMTKIISFSFFDDSQSRAFKAALAQKYKYTTDGYCSKYTCWNLHDVDESGPISASPTPYTVSLLDQVRVNTSDL